jgi:hypothetical protein
MITYSCEAERMDFYTQCCDVLFLKLSGQMSLDKGSLIIIVSGLSFKALQAKKKRRTL